jgi:hypothetical protein
MKKKNIKKDEQIKTLQVTIKKLKEDNDSKDK